MNQFTQEINDRLWQLWENHCPESETALVPWQHWDIKNNSLLFIGINPSFSKSNVQKRLSRGHTNLGNNWDEFKENHKWSNHTSIANKRMEIAEWWDPFIKPNPFKRFYELSNYLFRENSDWIYIDLFAWRQTKQKELMSKFKGCQARRNAEFWEGQLNIAFDIIKHVNPRIILVQNAFARNCFKHYAPKNGLQIEEPPIKEGYYYWLKNYDDRIPLFFSGMLYNQALDTDNFERLKWCMKNAL